MLTQEHNQRPNDTRVGWELAQEYCAHQDFSSALPIILHTLKCWREQHPGIPAEPLMHEIRIRCLTETRHHDEAFAAVAEAEAELPLFPIFPMLRQKLLVLQQRWQESLTAFEQYAELVKRYQRGETLQEESVVFGVNDYPQVLKAAVQSAVLAADFIAAERYLRELYHDMPENAVDTLAELAPRIPGETLLTMLAELAKQKKTPYLKQLAIAVLTQAPPDTAGLRPLLQELHNWPD